MNTSWELMIHKKFSLWAPLLIMLGPFTQLFSSQAQAGRAAQLYPRSVELSGNHLHFSMPEDFSKDMPADNMVESLDITKLNAFNNSEYGNIIRRWWDIKTPGWFGKNLGSVMMNIAVLPVADNQQHIVNTQPFDISNRLDFILMLDDAFHQRFDQLNKEIGPTGNSVAAYSNTFATVKGREIKSGFPEPIYNAQKWVSFGASAHKGMLRYFNIPLEQGLFIEVSFLLAHNDGINAWVFTDAAEKKIEPILNSLKVDYRANNPFNKIVGDDWHKITNTEALRQQEHAILKLFYGPDPEAGLKQVEKETAESTERIRQENLLYFKNQNNEIPTPTTTR